jgi:hypothetical protein
MNDRSRNNDVRPVQGQAAAPCQDPAGGGQGALAEIIPFWTHHPNYTFVNCSCGHTMFRLVCDLTENDDIRAVGVVCAHCGETAACRDYPAAGNSINRLQCGCGKTHWAVELDDEGAISAFTCTACQHRVVFVAEDDG